MSPRCGEIMAPSASSSDGLAAGLRAMNMLHIPKPKPLPSRLRKRRGASEPARLELTLEMPRERPSSISEAPQQGSEPDGQTTRRSDRGVADVDFYI